MGTPDWYEMTDMIEQQLILAAAASQIAFWLGYWCGLRHSIPPAATDAKDH